jgi:hypothetical protein
MVLPGIQALFGFQLIVVFSPGFAEKLTAGEQRLHLVAIALVALAIAFIMAPAALHRRDPHEVTATFIDISTRLLLSSMVPLAISISLECYLVGRVVVGFTAGVSLAIALLCTYLALWFSLPRSQRLQTVLRGRR